MKQPQLFENESGLSQCAVTSSAALSDCQKYRYALHRQWDDTKRNVLFIMLNPSTADASHDDPTIRRCIGFAKSWGFGGLHVVNLYALRSTDPKELLKASDPVGPDNRKWWQGAASFCEIAVCAWGNAPIVGKLQKALWPEYKPLSWISLPLHYIELSDNGTPKHPLYLRGDVQPQRYEVRRPHWW